MNDRQLHIDLALDPGSPERVAIRSDRPVHAARIFTNRAVGDVRELLPRLFSVCGIAQANASRQALAAATGRGPKTADRLDDELLGLMETAREHLWRVLIDWPGFVGRATDPAAAKAMQRLLPRLRAALADPTGASAATGAAGRSIEALDELLRDAVFGVPTEEWLAMQDTVELLAWASRTDTPAARLLTRVVGREWQAVGAADVCFLPDLSVAELERRLSAEDADDFVAAPEWQGLPCETTPLSRTRDSALVRTLRQAYGAGLLTRLTARLVELARVPAGMRDLAAGRSPVSRCDDGASQLPANTGIAQVDAARGRLVHRAVVDGGRVSRYQILAPTEWNFHPGGVLAASLDALRAEDRETLTEQASLLTDAIDPCVGYELRVH